jgi:hypothetical protein
MKHTFAWLLHVTDEILLFLTEFTASVSIDGVFVIAVLKLWYNQSIATDRDTLSQKADLIELFETFLTNAFHEDGVVHKVKGSYTGNADLGPICQSY